MHLHTITEQHTKEWSDSEDPTLQLPHETAHITTLKTTTCKLLTPAAGSKQMRTSHTKRNATALGHFVIFLDLCCAHHSIAVFKDLSYRQWVK